MNPQKFTEIIEKFADLRILIVGDLMLDRYWWGDVSRISPEAPVPVVHLKKTETVPGGAANVAANISGWGAKPILTGIIGDDADGGDFLNLLEKQNISTEAILKNAAVTTTVKTRIVAHQQHIVRVDREEFLSLPPEIEEKLFENFRKNVESSNAVLLSDYGKGTLPEHLTARLIKSANGFRKPIIVDPKGQKFAKYKNATILTPNLNEALNSVEASEHGGDLHVAGKNILKNLNLKHLIITKGSAGMTIFSHDGAEINLESSARQVYDVTGAGDTVISTVALTIAAGADVVTTAELANIAAGIVVEEVGTTAIKKKKFYDNFMRK